VTLEDQLAGRRPTWAEIDLDALAANYRLIRDRVAPGVKVLAAVKANAYGHGASECARRLESEGVDWFGVALPEEGIELRQAGITKPVLCLGGIWNGQERACLQFKLTPVVYRGDIVQSLDRAANEMGLIADAHVKIDTGMGRLGVRPDSVSEFCEGLGEFKNVRIDGLMTHLAAADDDAHEQFTKAQLDRFQAAVTLFRDRGFTPTFIHAANSAAAFGFKQSWGNMIRPGGTLYGFSRDVLPPHVDPPPLRPVMSLHSRIVLLKKLPKGEKLGYGCTFETQRDSMIATIPIGYDDGYPRGLSNRSHAIIRGVFATVIGRISMDLTLIDVTNVPGVNLNDEVVLMGESAGRSVSAEYLAKTAGTLSYEVTCGIGSRVPRLFVEG